MSCFFHFTLLVAVLALLSFCIQLALAAQSPPSPCNLLDPNSTLSSEKVRIDNYTLTLFKSLSLSLPTDHSLSFTFTIITSNDEDITSSDEDEAYSSLAFILMRSASGTLQSMELPLIACKKETKDQRRPCSPPHKEVYCNAHEPISQFRMLPPACTSSGQNSDQSDETEVSLSYDADAKQIRGRAVHNYSHASKLIKQTFNFSTAMDDSQLDVSNEITTLFVGYITSAGNANINVTSVALDVYDGKSNHKMVVVWVIVGVSVMVFLMGLLILVLFITKRRGRPPSLVRSHPAGGRGTPPSAPPFSHHDLESTATPMMKALPLSPPHNSAFQFTGTATWLKQPNPR